MAEPCPNIGFAGQLIGAACPDCGHTNVVHRRTDNICAVCDLKQTLVDDVIAEIDRRNEERQDTGR